MSEQEVKRRRVDSGHDAEGKDQPAIPPCADGEVPFLKRMEEAVAFCKKHATDVKVGIVCGSGLGSLADLIDDPIVLRYGEIPHFPQSTVHGHEGKLVIGKLQGVAVVAMKGRLHAYEGHEMPNVAFPVRVMCRLGIKALLLTNAAGGLNAGFSVGDIMIIQDHISFPSLCGINPLRGPHDELLGARFVPLNNVYFKPLQDIAEKAILECGLKQFMRKGVYVMVGGPSFETPAESRMLRMVGADAVGMSTVPEVIVAAQEKVPVLATSLITNKVIVDPESEEAPSHEEVIAAGKKSQQNLQKLFVLLVKQVGDYLDSAASA